MLFRRSEQLVGSRLELNIWDVRRAYEQCRFSGFDRRALRFIWWRWLRQDSLKTWIKVFRTPLNIQNYWPVGFTDCHTHTRSSGAWNKKAKRVLKISGYSCWLQLKNTFWPLSCGSYSDLTFHELGAKFVKSDMWVSRLSRVDGCPAIGRSEDDATTNRVDEIRGQFSVRPTLFWGTRREESQSVFHYTGFWSAKSAPIVWRQSAREVVFLIALHNRSAHR